MNDLPRWNTYWPLEELEAFCDALVARHPRWLSIETLATTRGGHSILALTVTDHEAPGPVCDRPALWLDGGTHCAEWAGVMGAAYCLWRWVEALAAGDTALRAFATTQAIHVAPCISPDGYAAMLNGAPYLRSTLRPPRSGEVRSGFVPCDLDGDAVVRWMRIRHPAGPWAVDPDAPMSLRRRRLDDAPGDAFFLCPEGRFEQWDGHRWLAAPLEFGLDLNRNFPAHWAPFSMFGMDGGDYPLSEVESRCVVDAVAARPGIAAGLTLHTYTGALLTQPYRAQSPLPKADQTLMHDLATSAVEGTGWRVYRTHPDFTYDPDKPIIGVWADTMSTVFGLPGYTLEVWDPFAAAGITAEEVGHPGRFFVDPKPELIKRLVGHFAGVPGASMPWTRFEHPQLGPVELGGIDELRTVRNPPPDALPAELEKVFTVAERLRLALPAVRVSVAARDLGETTLLEVDLENLGYLPTTGLAHGASVRACPVGSVSLEPGDGLTLIDAPAVRPLPMLEGWGSLQAGAARNPLYPDFSDGPGHRHRERFTVLGEGELVVHWRAHRAGSGTLRVRIGGA